MKTAVHMFAANMRTLAAEVKTAVEAEKKGPECRNLVI